MNPLAVLRRVSPKNLAQGVLLGLGHPLFLWPTIRATRECVRISTKLYGKRHHKNGPANAFRHALWNYMIAKRCGGSARAILWAEKVTHWHEEAFPNVELARRMDLHNNAVGRALLEDHPQRSQGESIAMLQGMAKESVKLSEGTDWTTLKNRLVHIIEADHER